MNAMTAPIMAACSSQLLPEALFFHAVEANFQRPQFAPRLVLHATRFRLRVLSERFEAFAHPVGALIYALEPLIDSPIETVEPIVGPAFPHRLHTDS